ncbi:MAG: hypothetical protein N2555_05510 [Endomicrobia bacterium]|nr:hypothetical protein [Endomicrobiia bacterium]
MKDILLLIFFVIAVIFVTKIVFKLTTFIAKLLLWIVCLTIVVFLFNYVALPKLGRKPLPLKEYVFNFIKPSQLKRQVFTKAKSVFSGRILISTETIKAVRDVLPQKKISKPDKHKTDKVNKEVFKNK